MPFTVPSMTTLPTTTVPSTATAPRRLLAVNVRLRGRPVAGQRLVAVVRPSRGAAYRWQLCTRRRCSTIRGATKPGIVVSRKWRGKRLRVVASAPRRLPAAATSAPVR
jgi:hypothetical protein